MLMSILRSRILRRTSSVLTLGLFCSLNVGCDKVETLVEDAKNDLGTSAPAPATPTTETAAPLPTPMPMQPSGPSAADVLRVLRSKASIAIDDTTLQAVALNAEAAGQVTELDLRANLQVTGAGLAAVSKFTNLTKLQLSGIQRPANTDFAVLGTLSALTVLEADQTHIGNDTLSAFGGLSQLKSLSLKGTQVQGAGVATLASLKNLEELYLDSTGTDDAAITAVTALPLKKLSLENTRVTNVGLHAILQSTTIEWLNVGATGVNGAGFAQAKALQLKVLLASRCNIGGVGMVNLRKFNKLEELSLSQASLDMENDKRCDFKVFPVLKRLNLGENPLSDIGVKLLISGCKSLETLSLNGQPRVTNLSLAELLKCKTLKTLQLDRTGVNAAGAQEMKKRNPEIEITLDGTKY